MLKVLIVKHYAELTLENMDIDIRNVEGGGAGGLVLPFMVI